VGNKLTLKIMPIKNIDAKTLKQWLANNEAIVVDVREPAEHEAKKIAGANLVPLANISKSSLPQYENKKLVLHCHSGKRSSSACQKLINEDPNLEIYNLEGGILAWNDAGCEIKSSGKFFLPLDRQVQLTIGLGVFIGSVLGFFVNPNFFLLSGFFGAGLIFAGLSGYCGLAIFMAKMPWNKGCKATSCLLGK
jgi:rhodanese-related sulfurtransferase